MKIKTKEIYDRIHAPLKLKSRDRKKKRIKTKQTAKNPIFKLFLGKPSTPLLDLLDTFMPSQIKGRSFGPSPSISGMRKSAGILRRQRKSQRRRSYLKMCRG